jgi:hypothetical protein
LEVLRRLKNSVVLDKTILIGSWCVPFYRDYFAKQKFMPAIRTRDVDLLIPAPSKIQTKVDVPELLKNLGFVVGFRGPKGYIKLEHPDLIVEFLVPEKGRGLDGPFPLPKLGLNAQALRFLNLLSSNIIQVEIEGISISLPHPVNFALHKLIVSKRRENPEKKSRDRDAALKVLRALFEKDEADNVRNLFDSLPQKWQKKIVSALEEYEEKEILKVLAPETRGKEKVG